MRSGAVLGLVAPVSATRLARVGPLDPHDPQGRARPPGPHVRLTRGGSVDRVEVVVQTDGRGRAGTLNAAASVADLADTPGELALAGLPRA